MNAVLKSGTSGFHGGMWEYFRNSKLDAADYFVGPFVLKQNIFGGDLGGPVAPKGKLEYFYVNYQGLASAAATRWELTSMTYPFRCFRRIAPLRA